MNDTAFEWFLKNLPERFKNAIHNTCQEEIQKTRELEKSQIISGVEHGCSDWGSSKDAEQYYNQTYNKNPELRSADGIYGKWGTSGDENRDQDNQIEKKVCENKVDGNCLLHNLFCKYPDCEN